MNKEEKTILLVDDEAIICQDQAETLKREGYHVITTISGESAIEQFKNGNQIDLILMDIDLGKGMDGTQTAEIILHDHDIPLIFLSNHTEMEIVKKTDSITSYGYVIKSAGESVLIAAIKMAFRLFRAYKENKQKTILLENSELRYRRLFESAQDGIFILNAGDGRIIDVNPYLMDLIGYTYDELIGKNLWDVSPFHDIVENKNKFKELQKQGYVHYENLPLLHKNGLIKHVEFVSNVYMANMSKVIQCNIRDIEKRKIIEDAKEAVLSEKITILQELQHRIRNSLSIIVSLINMESARLLDPLMKESLLNIRNRINSISKLYDLLSSSQDKENITFDRYIEKIITSLFESYFRENEKINFKMHLDSMQVDVDTALSVGLILNELVTNSIKYAFPDNQKGSIVISLERKHQDIIIEVYDNGIGTPSDFAIDRSEGLGISLVNILIKQINGNLLKLKVKKGTLFRIKFPFIKSIH